MRPLADWLGAGIVLVLALSVALILGSCRIAHAEEVSEVVLQTIAMESASEPEGMKYVALTLINRARLRGTTPEIEALRRKQYSCWNDRKWASRWLTRYYNPQVRQRASKAWYMALENPIGVTHYHHKSINPYWTKSMDFIEQIGVHRFYRENRLTK